MVFLSRAFVRALRFVLYFKIDIQNRGGPVKHSEQGGSDGGRDGKPDQNIRRGGKDSSIPGAVPESAKWSIVWGERRRYGILVGD